MTEEHKKLLTENHNLIYKFLSRYDLPEDEYYDVVALGLCKAVERFNEEVAKFSTFAYKVMYNEVAKDTYLRNMKKRVGNEFLMYYDDVAPEAERITYLDTIQSSDDTEQKVVIRSVIGDYVRKLKERDKKIIELLYLGYTTREIGEIVGCCPQVATKVRYKAAAYLEENGITV